MTIYSYIFIVGNQPELSRAELQVLLPTAQLIPVDGPGWLVESNEPLIPTQLIARLGGTLKIIRRLGEKFDQGLAVEAILGQYEGRKLRFGLSFYNQRPTGDGLVIKRLLQAQEINSRLVTSREPILSPVVITKNRCIELAIGTNWWGITEAVHDFSGYGRREFGRPESDSQAGMIPLKLARIMINLANQPADATIVDPFCGSGTIVSEALALGYRHIIGCDNSDKAVADTRANIDWLSGELATPVEVNIFLADARDLSAKVKMADAIITEPYLGVPIRAHMPVVTIRKSISEVEKLYKAWLGQAGQIVRRGGRVVFVAPEWHLGPEVVTLRYQQIIDPKIWHRQDNNKLLYHRPGQHVWRRIVVLERT